MKVVLVVGRDWKFRALLRAQLREEGYEALGRETLEEAEKELFASAPRPAALVFDTTDVSLAEAEPRLSAWAERLPVLVVAGAQEAVKSPPLQVLRRPLRIEDVLRIVKSLTTPHR